MFLRQMLQPVLTAGLVLLSTATVALAQAPEPVRAVIFLDASKSSQHLRPKMKSFVESFVGRLDPGLDKLVVYRLASTVEIVYEGPARKSPELRRNLGTYMKTRAEKGTGLRRVFERAAAESKLAESEKRRPVIIVLSDAADEPAGKSESVTPAILPALTKQLGSRAIVSFNFVTPTDAFTRKFEAIQAAMGADAHRRLFFTSFESEHHHAGVRRLAEALRR